jgi:hypothetical protein
MENAQQTWMPVEETKAPKMKVVFTIVERTLKNGTKKKFWVRLGVAWVNQDESLNVYLDATPVNGMIHIRDDQPFETRRNYVADALATPIRAAQ